MEHAPEIFAQESRSFKLDGSHAEDTVSDTAANLGYNITRFEPLNNGTIIVEAVKLAEGEIIDENNQTNVTTHIKPSNGGLVL